MENAQQLKSLDLGQYLSTSPNLSEIVPYVWDNGWTVSDDALFQLYNQIISDGLEKTVFFDGSIDSFARFVEALQSPANLPLIFFDSDGPAGFAWLNALKGSSAFAHFAFVKRAWGEFAKDIGVRVLNYWMSFQGDSGPLIHVILGTIPTVNRRAVRYVVEELGFQVCGRIPKLIRRGDVLHSAEIVFFERN